MSDDKKEKKKREKFDLKGAIRHLNKEFGDGSIMVGRNAIVNVKSVSTDVAGLDAALGIGGVPEGRIIEVYGPESSGKTSICLNIIAAYQKRGKLAAFVDAEHALDPVWAARQGVNFDTLLFSQPDSGEQGLDTARTLIETGEVGLVVIDSVAALVPQKELDGEITDSNIGEQARMMSKAMRVLNGVCSATGGTIIFINQIREKIGVMFGSPETTPGGRALKFYASCRLDIRKGETLREKDHVTGHVIKVKVIKNKVAAPFKTTELKFYYGLPEQKPTPINGFDRLDSLFSVAHENKILTTRGSNYYFGDVKLGNGRDAAYAAVAADEKLHASVVEALYSKFSKPAAPLEDHTDEELLEEFEDAGTTL